MKSKYTLFDKVIVNSPECGLKEEPGTIHHYDEEFFPEHKIIYLIYVAKKGYFYIQEHELKEVTGLENQELFYVPKFLWREIVLIRKNGFLKKRGVIGSIGPKNNGTEFHYRVTILGEDFYRENADLYDENESINFDEKELEKTGKFMSEEEYDKRYYSGVSLRIGCDGKVREITEGEDKLTDEQKEFLFGYQEDEE